MSLLTNDKILNLSSTLVERSRAGWHKIRFGDVVRNVDVSERTPLEAGLERYIGLEHLDPESLHIKRWGLIEEGTSFTRKFKSRQVLFGKRRAYQRKAAVAEFEGICSGDILVFEPADDQLIPELLPFIVQSEGFFNLSGLNSPLLAAYPCENNPLKILRRLRRGNLFMPWAHRPVRFHPVQNGGS